MTNRAPPQRSAISGVLLVFCLAALIGGLGFDLVLGARSNFWIADQPAAATAIGVAAALFAIGAGLLGRLFLGRKREQG